MYIKHLHTNPTKDPYGSVLDGQASLITGDTSTVVAGVKRGLNVDQRTGWRRSTRRATSSLISPLGRAKVAIQGQVLRFCCNSVNAFFVQSSVGHSVAMLA